MNILHLVIKDYMTPYVLMIWWWRNTISENIKANLHVFHLLLDCIIPEGSTCDTIDDLSLLNSLGEFNPKLMSPLVVSRTSALNLGDNPVPLLEDPTH